ncbi:protein jag [Sporosarcina sp. Marseille-Q4063]|uniref:RNA-binding cell elongation regulator Jag/EloR n=1 Tax=Sporosarcina sp. Marseille-Q4063 TaxID=2810514 RepID=UPI001BAF5D5C|nr:RNA-binding cell elongation regulator Jag/EloR [Sporosarcina sp. Marseille-Q4063]QUW20639.1 protein jag [Sporosarcina sp. Marseille-Q4063]
MTMMTQRGATVEAAIEAALQTLDVSRDKVKVEVLDQGRKGFFGIGSKEAEVKITVIEKVIPIRTNDEESEAKSVAHEETIDLIEDVAKEEVKNLSNDVDSDEEAIKETELYLISVAKEMKIDDLDISYEIDGKYVNFQLESEKAALLIGKRGQTLNALQQLGQLVANKNSSQFKVVRIDVGDYRGRREQSLEQLAERMADRAVRTGRKVQLEPMPAYERKVIHHSLSSRLDIETYSEGSDPYRYLVIEPIR